MPLEEDLFGTNKNKSLNEEFCKFCFKNGRYIKPNLKLKDAIEFSIDHMITKLKINREEAEFLAYKTIPNLERWKKKQHL